MDKRVIFAAAGSGKTTYIIDSLSKQKRALILTYTDGNYLNLCEKVRKKFSNRWPKNITVMTYFSFLYGFCYKPFLADELGARGILYKPNPNQYYKQEQLAYYLSNDGYFYSNRLAFLLEQCIIDDIKTRILKYFDVLVIDEIQDIAGRDFSFLEHLMQMDLEILFVGDFYQHTFDTSRDGNYNKLLFKNKAAYEKRFIDKGFIIDNITLQKSWRCSKNVCDYIRDKIGIEIYSNRLASDNTSIEYVTDIEKIRRIIIDAKIIKLHYQNGAKAGVGHKNWGETKGEDKYQDVCVLLNKNTAAKRKEDKLSELAPSTKNKLYVAITRARGNVYLIDEQ